MTSAGPRHRRTPSRFEREVAADHRFERRLVVKELVAILAVAALVAARQLWFL